MMYLLTGVRGNVFALISIIIGQGLMSCRKLDREGIGLVSAARIECLEKSFFVSLVNSSEVMLYFQHSE